MEIGGKTVFESIRLVFFNRILVNVGKDTLSPLLLFFNRILINVGKDTPTVFFNRILINVGKDTLPEHVK